MTTQPDYEHQTTKLVFRITRTTDLQRTHSYLKDNPHKDRSLETTTSLNDAFDASNLTVEETVSAFEILEARLSKEHLFSLSRVSITVSIKDMNMADEALVEERRRRALAKLSIKDIEALGVGKMASYNKLRYHNTEQQDG